MRPRQVEGSSKRQEGRKSAPGQGEGQGRGVRSRVPAGSQEGLGDKGKLCRLEPARGLDEQRLPTLGGGGGATRREEETTSGANRVI